MSSVFFWLGIIAMGLTLLCLAAGVTAMGAGDSSGKAPDWSHYMMRGRIAFQWLAVFFLLLAALTR